MQKFIAYASYDNDGYGIIFKAFLHKTNGTFFLSDFPNSYFQANSERDLIRKIKRIYRVRKTMIPPRPGDWASYIKFLVIIE